MGNQQELFERAWALDIPAVETLLQAGGEVNSLHESGDSLLGWVARREGGEKMIKTLLAHGAAIDSRENQFAQTALIIAAANCRPENIKVLLKAGADLTLRDEGGKSALMQAVAAGCLKVVKILVKAGANVNEVNGDTTPLMMAVGTPQPDRVLVEYLLEKGAEINADHGCGTALWEAIAYENLAWVKYLIGKGAKVEGIKSRHGETTLDFARRVGNERVLNFLQK